MAGINLRSPEIMGTEGTQEALPAEGTAGTAHPEEHSAQTGRETDSMAETARDAASDA